MRTTAASQEAKLITSFFSYFYMAINIGSLFSSTALVYVRIVVHTCYTTHPQTSLLTLRSKKMYRGPWDLESLASACFLL